VPAGADQHRRTSVSSQRCLDGAQTDESGGVEVIDDRMSGPDLGGATIDFVDTIEKQGFTIDNPNAGGSCACGDSFH
jgi:iron-sulfur cluster assembly accessory protein